MRKLPLRLYAVAFGAWSCLFFAACGLDQVYLLEPPIVRNNNVYVNTELPENWYVEFITNEAGNAAYYPSRGNSFVFLGTEIYYKIYNNVDTLQSHKRSIESVNSASYYSESASRMITTYQYQPLDLQSGRIWFPFVECREKNTKVHIRLVSYQGKDTDPTYKAGVWFDDDDQNVVPYRNGNNRSFDFFNDANEQPPVRNVPPNSGDNDFSPGTGGGAVIYYVQLYAVAVGRDSNYTPSYSPVLDLGTIPIYKQK